jgi:hypothetical protein
MVLAQKQTGRPMDTSRHKPTYLQPTDLQQRSPKHTMKKRTASSINVARETGCPHVED